ncbi:TPA: hypothetical protein SMV41_000243 [Proteus mirabilis]|nr:hypothetical protein [Proteus mirabilis]HDU8441702.1 hypothetical protein [Proteus mirabilis]HEJ9535842.1 hypothetical protein [Proteus mirabilis]HEK2674348.1 hypothetical protein [Proteus mirabilis]HEK3121520.1 hypothetical protein [Proteus mirabilis]
MKIKYFNIITTASHEELHKFFLDNPFNENKGWGFSIEKYSSEYLYVKYSEKVNIIEDVIDPYGCISYFEYNKYINFYFYLFKRNNLSYPLLIESSPRSIKNFILNLNQISNHRLKLENKTFDINSLIRIFKEESFEMKIKSIKVKNLVISKYTSANIELTSSKDAHLDLNNYFNEPKYIIDKIKLITNDTTYEITTNGSVITTEEDIEKIYSLLS